MKAGLLCAAELNVTKDTRRTFWKKPIARSVTISSLISGKVAEIKLK